MKKYLVIFLLLLTRFCPAQIEHPVTWAFKAKAINDTDALLTLTATIEKHWHIYSQHIEGGGPVPTSFTFTRSEDYDLMGSVAENSKPTKAFDQSFNMNILWFEHKAVFSQKIKLKKPGTTVKGSLEFMVCNDVQCLPPDQVEFSIPVSPEKTKEKKSTEDVHGNPISKDSVNETVFKKAVQPEIQENPLDIEQKSKKKAVSQPLWLTFLAGLLGGFAAILMPCIFPMLPMTVSFFTKQKGSKADGIRKSMLYGLSIIVIYVSLGLCITVFFGADALNNLSTNGIFNFAFFVLLLAFAASFLGAFELMLPASWLNAADSKADKGGFLGIFFMATTLALVSFSCTGPIIGTLLVQAATMGQILGPAVGMFGFALALALPFTLFAMFPSWLNALPKSGGWLNSVKVVLGFLELALALKFLSNVDLAYHWEWFDREVFLVLWIVIFGFMSLYLLGKLKFSHDSPLVFISTPRLFLAIISTSFTFYMVPGLWGAPLQSIAAFLPPQHTQDFDLYTGSLGGMSSSASEHRVSVKYSDIFHAPLNLNTFFDYEEGLAYARKVNKPVMIDFTGHACVNCRKMEATVWSKPEVLKRLREDYVLIQLYVDDKTELAKNEQTTSVYSGKFIKTIGNKWSDMQAQRFNANSQPYYVLFDSNEKSLVAPQGADYEPENFVRFLDEGKKVFRERK
ncbi:Thiol:disulfide interchange protein DsbD [Pseudarcicella hirudinis]|uniref:Thiol:disulfide interchange protein DsbD n=1 Tax=Pseudarcicella hirudinis TaxID=1079859 RepID=A0A1I5NMQ0_9BACT|nr:cytochrome c biogenesis protein CcdA [Pseudarcicella hirudinis]SFP22920.1 Thiol:disulfide interchange protein DsbD [Pseudarcicella hirudinis]